MLVSITQRDFDPELFGSSHKIKGDRKRSDKRAKTVSDLQPNECQKNVPPSVLQILYCTEQARRPPYVKSCQTTAKH